MYHPFIQPSVHPSIHPSIHIFITHPSIIHYSTLFYIHYIYSYIQLLTILHPSTSCIHIFIFSPFINHYSSIHPCSQLLSILHPSIHPYSAIFSLVHPIHSVTLLFIYFPTCSFLPSFSHSLISSTTIYWIPTMFDRSPQVQQLYTEFLLYVWHQSSYKTTKTCKVPALMRRHTLDKYKRGNCSHGWVLRKR